MDSDKELFVKDFYKNLEDGIHDLPQAERSKLYKGCAENCVKKFVLPTQRKLFEECGNDLDTLYQKYGRSEFLFADIIEKGHIYEIGYPTEQCLCPMVSSGMTNSSTHCECSRQSILCVLKTLLPEKNIEVEMMHSVLTGCKECRFRVKVE